MLLFALRTRTIQLLQAMLLEIKCSSVFRSSLQGAWYRFHAEAGQMDYTHNAESRPENGRALTGHSVQEQTVVERARLDAAAAAEDAQDAKEARLRGLKQEQERLFIHDYLAGQEHTKFNQALDHAAEDAR